MRNLVVPEALTEKKSIDDRVSIYQFYRFVNDKKEILSFIERYSLWNFLLEGPWEIKRIFGDAVVLELELHRDIEEDFDELFIVIRSSYTPEKARKLMDKLAEEWFLNIIDKTKNKLCITEEPL